MKSVLKDWVMELGLRQQGVLLAAVRGCDDAPKHDASKLLARCYRNEILNCFNGDPLKASSFIECLPLEQILKRMDDFRKNLDHYPHHYVMHIIHAAGIIGYYHPDPYRQNLWGNQFYQKLCKALHMVAESKQMMDDRLNAIEEVFKLDQT